VITILREPIIAIINRRRGKVEMSNKRLWMEERESTGYRITIRILDGVKLQT
jgi:hypothetical protein